MKEGVEGVDLFSQLSGGTGNLVASLNTTSVAGCIEIIQAAVRKILGCEAKLGDSFVLWLNICCLVMFFNNSKADSKTSIHINSIFHSSLCFVLVPSCFFTFLPLLRCS